MPESEDDLIDHEYQNRMLSEITYEDKPPVEGRHVLKLIEKSLEHVGANASKTLYGYHRLILQGKKLTNLYNWLEQYPLIRKLNLSNNLLKNIDSVLSLPYVEELIVTNNKLENMSVLNNNTNGLQFLYRADFSKNLLKKMEAITIPR